MFDSDANLKWSPENTIYRACELFEQLTGNRLYLRIFLRKRIPSGGGLGGGSSDAATILSFLASKYRVDAKAIYEISKKIGSDVPFFLKGGTAIGKGRGEILEYLKGLSEYRVSLIFPNVSVQTAYAYKLLDERGTKKILDDGNVYKLYEAFLEKNYNRIRELSKNDFEKVVSEAFPEIKGKYVEAIESLKEDAIMVRMSGSGSTLFMLYLLKVKMGNILFFQRLGEKTMTFDGVILYKVSKTMTKIQNESLRQVYQKDRWNFFFKFRSGMFQISLHPEWTFLVFRERFTPGTSDSSKFLQFLRSRLTGAVLRSIEQHGMDRILSLDFEKKTPSGRKRLIG